VNVGVEMRVRIKKGRERLKKDLNDAQTAVNAGRRSAHANRQRKRKVESQDAQSVTESEDGQSAMSSQAEGSKKRAECEKRKASSSSTPSTSLYGSEELKIHLNSTTAPSGAPSASRSRIAPRRAPRDPSESVRASSPSPSVTSPRSSAGRQSSYVSLSSDSDSHRAPAARSWPIARLLVPRKHTQDFDPDVVEIDNSDVEKTPKPRKAKRKLPLRSVEVSASFWRSDHLAASQRRSSQQTQLSAVNPEPKYGSTKKALSFSQVYKARRASQSHSEWVVSPLSIRRPIDIYYPSWARSVREKEYDSSDMESLRPPRAESDSSEAL
jgi:hypothetical protein